MALCGTESKSYKKSLIFLFLPLAALGEDWSRLDKKAAGAMVSKELKILIDRNQVVKFGRGLYKLAGPVDQSQQVSADQSDATAGCHTGVPVPAAVAGGSNAGGETHASQTASKEQKRKEPVGEPAQTKRQKQASGAAPMTSGGGAAARTRQTPKRTKPAEQEALALPSKKPK
jgi:hypothetical protein